MIKALWILLLSLVCAAPVFGQAALTGTIKLPDGSLWNGRLGISISQAASVSGTCGGPYTIVPGHEISFSVTNGAIQDGATLVTNDCLSPTNTCYVVREIDANGNSLAQFRWNLTGPGPIDIGTVPPSGPGCGLTVTSQTIPGPVSIIGDLNVTGNINYLGQVFQSQIVQGTLNVQGGITGTLLTTAPVGTGLKSDGSQYVTMDNQVAGSGTCPFGQYVESVNADLAPTCVAVPHFMSAFLPGALTSTWTGSNITLDSAITVTRMTVTVKTSPVGCSVPAVVRLTDGVTNEDISIDAATNQSGSFSQAYAAGAVMSIRVLTAASGCGTSPADANVQVEYTANQ